jgi:chromosome segregation ATPase
VIMGKKKRVKKVQKTNDDFFYVGVRDPVEVRRSVLESYREAVHFLQRFEKLKAIREEKSQVVQRLRLDMKELKSLTNKLRRSLPKTKLRIKLHKEHVEEEKVEEEKKHKKKHVAKKTVKKPVSDLERLESELNEIEGKLDSIA